MAVGNGLKGLVAAGLAAVLAACGGGGDASQYGDMLRRGISE